MFDKLHTYQPIVHGCIHVCCFNCTCLSPRYNIHVGCVVDELKLFVVPCTSLVSGQPHSQCFIVECYAFIESIYLGCRYDHVIHVMTSLPSWMSVRRDGCCMAQKIYIAPRLVHDSASLSWVCLSRDFLKACTCTYA